MNERAKVSGPGPGPGPGLGPGPGPSNGHGHGPRHGHDPGPNTSPNAGLGLCPPYSASDYGLKASKIITRTRRGGVSMNTLLFLRIL